MKANSLIIRLLVGLSSLCVFGVVEAGSPLWTFTPLTATTLSIPSNNMATVQYLVTNQSKKTHTLGMQSLQGMTQLTTGLGVCGNPFVLRGNASCTLSLQVNGSQLTSPINDGPIICEQGSTLQCYRPAATDILHITQAPPITDATITVTSSPLTLTTNGPAGTLTINNTSLIVTATSITSSFTSTALQGNVTESGNTCASVAPLGSCTLTYTPSSTVVAATDFTIQGSNTNTAEAAIQIDPPVLSCKGAGGGCRVFVTNASWATGDIQAELKYTCTDQSSAAAVANCACNNDDNKPTGAGSYLAWLSNGAQTGSAIVGSTANLTYIAPQNSGATLWDPTSTLVSGNNPYVAIAPGFNPVWSGLNADGTPSGQNCSNWTSNSALQNGSFGDPGQADNNWSNQGQQSCDGPGFGTGLNLYCIETPS
jgi:hypothetical protein